MKRLITTLFVVACVQTFCYAANENKPDSTKIEYQIFGNDTLVIEKVGYMFVSGFKQYIDVVAAVDSVQKIALHHFKRVAFVEGKDIAVRFDIGESGEVLRCNFVFPSEYSDEIWSEHIYAITKKIKENIKFVPPGKYGCNAISIDIPVNGLQYK